MKKTETVKPETFTLEVSRTVKEKVEMTLPAYFKSNCHQVKVISQNQLICITESSSGDEIGERTWVSIQNFEHPSTEAEFNEAYNRVMSRLNAIAIPNTIN